MFKLSNKTKEKTGMVGLHTWSVCDVRHQTVDKIQRDIQEYTAESQQRVRGMQQRIQFLKQLIRDTGSYRIDLIAELEDLREQINVENKKRHWDLSQLYSQMRDLTLVQQLTVPNILPTAGRTVVAEWLTGTNTSDADAGANYGSLGSGSTTPVDGNTQLNTETYRKATSSATNSSNVAYLSNFYSATEVTGTFEEAGWHIDATATANTGDLLSHFLTSTITKSSTETLTIESQITVS